MKKFTFLIVLILATIVNMGCSVGCSVDGKYNTINKEDSEDDYKKTHIQNGFNMLGYNDGWKPCIQLIEKTPYKTFDWRPIEGAHWDTANSGVWFEKLATWQEFLTDNPKSKRYTIDQNNFLYIDDREPADIYGVVIVNGKSCGRWYLIKK
jgi:hypothetical protein